MNHCRSAILALVILAIPSTASAESRYLCTSVPGACEHTGPSAPELGAEVCYDPASGELTLKGTASCLQGARPFHVSFGEVVDPILGIVVAYSPLDDACAAGQCVAYQPHDGGQEYPICCEYSGACWPGVGCDGVLFWCNDGVCEGDGTITCFDADQL